MEGRAAAGGMPPEGKDEVTNVYVQRGWMGQPFKEHFCSKPNERTLKASTSTEIVNVCRQRVLAEGALRRVRIASPDYAKAAKQ